MLASAKAQPGALRELCFEAFAVLHSGQAKTPVYVVERLNRKQLLDARGEERTDKFYSEARLPSAERAQLSDYRAEAPWVDGMTKFDRGHLAAAGNMPNPQAMAQSFSLANVVPQAAQNNRKTWNGIEKATRQYVLRAKGDVFVFSGPVYEEPVVKLGPGQVWIPRYLFKLVYDAETHRAWAHWVENTDSFKPGRPLSYAELVRRTGIEFLQAEARAQ